MCLALSLCFLAVSSQAQGSGNVLAGLKILKAEYMYSQMWEPFGAIGATESVLKLYQTGISQVTISTTLNSIGRNIALATEGCDGEAAFSSDKTARYEKGIEGIAYVFKSFVTYHHNRVIGMSKILTLMLEDYFSLFLSDPSGAKLQDSEKEAAKTFKLIESLVERSPLYFINKELFYKVKGINKLVDSTVSFCFSWNDDFYKEIIDHSNFVTLNRVSRIFTYSGLSFVLLPTVITTPFSLFNMILLEYKLLNDALNDTDSPHSSASRLSGQRKSSVLESCGDSNFRDGLNLEENGNIKKALFFYRQAFGYYTSGAVWEDGDSESKSHCENMKNKCLEKIGKLINHLKINVIFKRSEGEVEKQNSSSTFEKCVTKIYGAKNETEIKEALIEYKKSTRSLWARIFSSNNDQLEQLIGQL
jgi:hypothetical protein